MQEKVWNDLLSHPDVALWGDDARVMPLGLPEVLVCKDLAQLEALLESHPAAAAAPYVVLRGDNGPETARRLVALGYDCQWCRPRDEAGAVAEGVDYLAGPWSGEMPEQCELLGRNGSLLRGQAREACAV